MKCIGIWYIKLLQLLFQSELIAITDLEQSFCEFLNIMKASCFSPPTELVSSMKPSSLESTWPSITHPWNGDIPKESGRPTLLSSRIAAWLMLTKPILWSMPKTSSKDREPKIPQWVRSGTDARFETRSKALLRWLDTETKAERSGSKGSICNEFQTCRMNSIAIFGT